MKHKMWSRLLSMALAVSVSAMPALAAEGDTSSTEPTTYVVTFRPGEHGRFTDSFIDGLKAYGAVRTSEATGAVVAPTLQGSAPVGQNLTFYALNNIENYTAEVASQQLTISANADENVVTFHYTAGVNNVTETVTVPGDTVTIPETETPQAGGDNIPGGEDVEIPDESTPQANLPGENANGSMMPMVLGGAALAIVVIAAIVWAINRRANVDGE